MNENKEKLAGESGLRFHGTIAASASHEINNVLAIIKEYTGLLGDLIAGPAEGRSSAHETLNVIIQKLDNQVHRGQAITKRLNRCAHLADRPVASFSLTEPMVEFLPRHPALPVILFTGHGSVAGARRRMPEGAFDYIMKPIDIDAWIQKIESAAGRKKVERRE